MTFLSRKWFQVLIIAVAVVTLLFMPSPLPDYLTTYDFQAYWGASHLLSRSENFTNPDLLLEIEQGATGFDQETPLLVWNPPWLSAWLLPLGAIGFARASWLWFLSNIALIFASTVMLWQTFSARPRTMRWLWLGLLLSFTFIPTLTTLLVGQITALILFGMAAFIFLENRQKFFLAGMALSLTTAKPHVIYLTLGLLLPELIFRKQWRTIAGFITPVLAGTAFAFLLRPSFLSEYVDLMTGSRLLQRTSVPTPVSYLADLLQLPWLRFFGIGVLVAGLGLWWRSRRRSSIALVQLVSMTLVISLLTTPYGWSFDFTIFLVPLLQLAVSAIEDRIPRFQAGSIAALLIVANTIVLYQRTLQVPESSYFWFPLLLASLLGWGWFSVATKQSS